MAELVNIDIFTYAALFAALPCLIALFFGWRVSLSLWHLHLFFLLPLPLWDGVLETLVQIASAVCSNFMKLFDLPMLIEGNSITIPSGRILIAEGCSGIRYFLVSIMLGYLLANLNGYNGWRLVLTIACSAFLGLFANWVRIILLIFIGYHSEMQSSLMSDHETFGWVVFAAFCMPALYFAPQHRAKTRQGPFYDRPSLHQGLVWLILGGLITGAVLWLRTPPEATPTNHQDFLAHWQAIPEREPIGVPAPTVPYRSFNHQQRNISLTLVTHQRQSAEDKLVPFFVQSRVGSEWFLEKRESLKVTRNTKQGGILSGTAPDITKRGTPESGATKGGMADSITQTLTVEQFKSLLSNTRVLSVQIFQVGDEITGSYTEAKLLQIPALLTRQNAFTYYLLQSPCDHSNCDQARKALQSALTHITPDSLRQTAEH